MYRPGELLSSQKQLCRLKHQALTLHNPLIKGVWLLYARPSYPTWLQTKIIPCFGKYDKQVSKIIASHQAQDSESASVYDNDQRNILNSVHVRIK